MVIMYWTVFSSFFVPYLAWGSDLTDDYNEKNGAQVFCVYLQSSGNVRGHGASVYRVVDCCMNMVKTEGIMNSRIDGGGMQPQLFWPCFVHKSRTTIKYIKPPQKKRKSP